MILDAGARVDERAINSTLGWCLPAVYSASTPSKSLSSISCATTERTLMVPWCRRLGMASSRCLLAAVNLADNGLALELRPVDAMQFHELVRDFDGLFLRLHLDEREAANHLLGLGKRSVHDL
jgi:hypothetical protein